MDMKNKKILTRFIDWFVVSMFIIEYFHGRIPILHTVTYIITGIFYSITLIVLIPGVIIIYKSVFTNKFDDKIKFNETSQIIEKKPIHKIWNIFNLIIGYTGIVFMYLTEHWFFFVVSIIVIVFGRIVKLPIIKDTLARKTIKNLLLGDE